MVIATASQKSKRSTKLARYAPPLYHLVVPPEMENLYFIGLLHSMMSLMPARGVDTTFDRANT